MTPPAASAAGRTLPRPVAPRAPRRVSGPAARPRRGEDSARRRRAAAPDPFILRALHRTQRLSDSRLLDRLIRGRLWIPLVAAGLMGIVFMQVSMLKLNAGIGRAVQSAGTLERQNQSLRADVSRMEAGSKIDAVARNLGMVEPSLATGPNYVSASARGLASAAAKRMTPADPDAILRAKQATALANGQAASTVTGTATAGVAATTAGATTTAAGTTGTATTAAATTPQAPVATTTPTPPAQTQAATPPAATPQAATTPPASATTGGTGTTTGAVAATQQAPSTTSGGAVAPVAG
jgi:hypothetical protein